MELEFWVFWVMWWKICHIDNIVCCLSQPSRWFGHEKRDIECNKRPRDRERSLMSISIPICFPDDWWSFECFPSWNFMFWHWHFAWTNTECESETRFWELNVVRCLADLYYEKLSNKSLYTVLCVFRQWKNNKNILESDARASDSWSRWGSEKSTFQMTKQAEWSSVEVSTGTLLHFDGSGCGQN